MFLASGQAGHQPLIFIWHKSQVIHTLAGHKYGVISLAFSKDASLLASMGHFNDGNVYIWDWKNGTRLAGIKITTRLSKIAFDGFEHLVTIGDKHIKYWSLTGISSGADYASLKNDSVTLGSHINMPFCDVASGNGPFVYTITDTGILSGFNNSRIMEKWVDTKIARGTCIFSSVDYIFCGGSDGLVRIFEPLTLKYVTTLPKPDSIPSNFNGKDALFYPSAISINSFQFNEKTYVAVSYSNNCIITWDISQINAPIKSDHLIFQSNTVLGQSISGVGDLVTYSSDGNLSWWEMHNSIPLLSQTIQTTSIIGSSESKSSRTLCLLENIVFSGDKNGKLTALDLVTMKSNTVNAYESEIMCLKACRIEKLILVGTSSRDKSQKIFSFSLEESFKLLYTSNDHNGVTTCISFSGNGQWLVTFSQDKVLDLNFVSETVGVYKRCGRLLLKTTVHDITVTKESHALLASQDKKIRRVNLITCTVLDELEISLPLTPCLLDFHNEVIIAGCIEKGLIIVDETKFVQTKYTHAEMIVGAFFLKDGQSIVTLSADGCTCIWKCIPKTPISASSNIFQFDDKVLPAWARDDYEKGEYIKENFEQRQIAAKGRWAERVVDLKLLPELESQPALESQEDVMGGGSMDMKDSEQGLDEKEDSALFPKLESQPAAESQEDIVGISSVDMKDSEQAFGEKANSALFEPSLISNFADVIESDVDDLLMGRMTTPNPPIAASSVSSPIMSLVSTASPQYHRNINSPADQSSLDSRLELFLELANEISEKIASIPEAESERLRSTCNSVAGLIMPHTNSSVWIKQLIEAYSEKLVEMVREKISKLPNIEKQ